MLLGSMVGENSSWPGWLFDQQDPIYYFKLITNNNIEELYKSEATVIFIPLLKSPFEPVPIWIFPVEFGAVI